MRHRETGRAWAILGVFALLSWATVASAVQVQLAFVDFEEVFSNYWKTKQADRSLQLSSEAYKQERETLLAEFKQTNESLNTLREAASDPTLGEQARAEKADAAIVTLEELNALQDRINTFDQEQQSQLDRQKQRMRTAILKDIIEALERVGRTEGYTAIFDSSGFSFNGLPVVVFSDPRNDITRSVIELLNLGGPSEE